MALDSTRQFAFLQHGSEILYAKKNNAEIGPFSAVTRLIQGIYEQEPAQARKILRNRIYTNAPATEMCWGMVKVAAKRMTDRFSFKPDSNFLPMKERSFAPQLLELSVNGNDMKAAQALLQHIPAQPNLYLSDRSIAAILIGPDQNVLTAAVNQNSLNRTLHAEIVIVQNYFLKFGKRIPLGSTLFSTRKPCKMCAAFLWHWSEDPTQIKIYYDEEDLGPKARETVFNPGTFERKRAARNQHELEAQIEFKLTSAD